MKKLYVNLYDGSLSSENGPYSSSYTFSTFNHDLALAVSKDVTEAKAADVAAVAEAARHEHARVTAEERARLNPAKVTECVCSRSWWGRL